MIKIEIYKKNGLFFGFRSKGHADYSDGEYDIVCAGVSTLTQTLYFYLHGKGITDTEESQKQGYLYYKIKRDIEKQEVQGAFEFMITGLELLQRDYSKYIQFKIMEVQND
ncbi:MAG: ribosomal-processing cysteine protease Prp [Peptoniphilus sp.]|nr:ribosomal-processing cysteine protease Prp [Peptoniphilus sp.]